VPLQMRMIGNNAVLTWNDPTFGLQAASKIDGPYTNVPGASSPFTNPINGSQAFFRLKTD
jgi:hypothetical protein